jgi:hypothetical protein
VATVNANAYSSYADAPDDLKDEKKKTREAAANVSFSIVQDELRAELYSSEYGVPKDRIILMPVAGSGAVPYVKSKYLHQLFRLDENVRILLHMGSLAPWSMSDWLIEHAPTMPDGWVLVVHGRYGNDLPKKMNVNRVYFTDSPVEDFDDLKNTIQSASCIAVLYKPCPGSPYTGKNIGNIGLASGKFAVAMQHGVPVLVQSLGTIGDLVQEYNAGMVFSPEQEDTLEVLSKLHLEYNCWRNCQSLFFDKLDLNNSMPRVLALLQKQKRTPHASLSFAEEPKKQLRELFREARKLQKEDIIKLYVEAFSLVVSDVIFRTRRRLNI